MFESLVKNDDKLKEVLKEAFETINSLPEDSRHKVSKAFRLLDTKVEQIKHDMQEYEKYDAIMDDAASRLTALTKVDVREQGIRPALTAVLRYGNYIDQAEAIEDVILWNIASTFKKSLSYE